MNLPTPLGQMNKLQAALLDKRNLPHGYSKARRDKPQPTTLFIAVMTASIIVFAVSIFLHIHYYN